MRRVVMFGLLVIVLGAVWGSGAWVPGVVAHARTGYAASFPDVPPWHWAHDGVRKAQDAGIVIGYPASGSELVVNAVTQVYDGFAHAAAPDAQAWVERFTYNRPPAWPQPLQRSRIVRFSIQDPRPSVSGDTASARFTAVVYTAQGRDVSTIRIALRRAGDDWQVDYASLAAGSALFR